MIASSPHTGRIAKPMWLISSILDGCRQRAKTISMESLPNQVEVFLGAPIEDRTERAMLARVLRDLDGTRAVVFGNFQLGRNALQIDFLIATETAACVVETKGYMHPVLGQENGQWEEVVDGQKRPLTGKNPYVQARDNRFAVIDALVAHDIGSRDDALAAITGLVCVFPSIPPGSSLTPGNHKAYVGDYQRLRELLNRRSSKPISLEDWKTLAQRAGLQPPATPSSDELETLKKYRTNFQDLRRSAGARFVEAPSDPPETRIAAIAGQLLDGKQLQLIGQSGSGKTALVEHLADTLCSFSCIPVVVHAYQFQDNLGSLLKRAIASATASPAAELVRAAHALGCPIVVFVDAVNECVPAKRNALIAALQALRLSWGAQIVVSGQEETTLPPLLSGDKIHLPRPDQAKAQKIVESHSGRALGQSEQHILGIVASAHDAAVLSEVLRLPNAVDSRYALYSAFTRKRLGAGRDGTVAHQTLAVFANDLRAIFATGVASAVAKAMMLRAVGANANAGEIEHVIAQSGLLTDKDGFVRFRHDLIADYFAAERLVSDAGADAVQLGKQIARPIFADLAEFALGAAPSSSAAGKTLQFCSTPKLLVGALKGRCGRATREWVLASCETLVERITRRFTAFAPALAEQIGGGERFPGIDPGLDDEDYDELSPYLQVLSYSIGSGLLSRLLQMFGEIDQHLLAEAARLKVAHPEFRMRWSAEVSGAIYGFSMLTRDRTFNTLFQTHAIYDLARAERDEALFPTIADALAHPERLSIGQLYFLIEMLRGFDDFDAAPPDNLAEIMATAWGMRMYHLSLAAIDLGQRFGRRLSDEKRKAVGEMLETWLSNNHPVLNGAIFDVLQIIGCWTPAITVDDAADEFRTVLAQPVSADANDAALTMYVKAFDHPDRETYAEAYYDKLHESERQKLCGRAIAAEDRIKMFISFALGEVVENPSLDALDGLNKWARLPTEENMSGTQESVSVFANASCALAKLNQPLPPIGPDLKLEALAWRKYGELLHAMNSTAPARAPGEIWKEIEGLGAAQVLEPLHHLQGPHSFRVKGDTDIIGRFAAGVAEASRAALRRDYVGTTLFDRCERRERVTSDHRQFALAQLAKSGRPSDLALISQWIDDITLGTDALRAARAVEERSKI